MNALFPIFLGAGLLGPGWLLGRALQTKGGLVTAFIGSAAILTNVLVILDVLNIGLTLPNIAGAIGIICVMLVTIGSLRRVPSPIATKVSADPRLHSIGDFTAERHHRKSRYIPHVLLLLPAVTGLLAIAFKSWVHPLSGYDTYFRWDFLARQILHYGNLHFYPPVSAGDFERYGWCDSIAPLISGMYYWAYSCLGTPAPWATAPLVVAQAGLLFMTVYRLAALKGGVASGWAAVAILGSSSILLWGIAMGQETGMTALSLTALFLFLEAGRRDDRGCWWVWAGIAAGTGALAREYGLLFIAVGMLDLRIGRARRDQWMQFALAALATAGPWYFRTWMRTGNPVWPHNVVHLFPTNAVHADYLRVVQECIGIGTASAQPWAITRTTLVLIACPLFFGFWGLAQRWRSLSATVAVIALVLLWIWSIGQTSGGYIYSMRVLTPVIALCSVAAGRLLAKAATAKRGWLLGLGLSVIAVDAAGRSLFVDALPLEAWWRLPLSAWTQTRDASVVWAKDPTWRILTAAANGKRIVVYDAFAHAALARLGARPVHLFSPELSFLFESTARFDACIAQLKALGFRFILLASDPGIHSVQLPRYPFFKTLKEMTPTAANSSAQIYDLSVIGLSEDTLKP